ncbi:hypothetical protein CR513_55915, partial [Mucuna pruriens]
MSGWNLHINGAPYRHVPYFVGGKSNWRRIPIWKVAISESTSSQLNLNQGQHTTPRFGPAGSMSRPNQSNYQHKGLRYQAPAFHQQPQQQMPPRENSSAMEDLMKQMSVCNIQFQQNITTTIHDLKMQSDAVGRFRKHSLPNNSECEREGVGTMQLRSGRELPSLATPQPRPGLAKAETELRVDSRVQQSARGVPLLIPNRTVLERRSVEAILEAIKQVPKYAKFLKELCVHKRNKIKGAVETGGIVSALVNKLIFPADFYVLDIRDEAPRKGSILIVGRPFLMTARTKIDMYVGTLSMEFGETFMVFNIFEVLKHPAEDHSIFSIDTIDELIEEYPLPKHLKYAYLEDHQQFSVIIANNLSREKEEKLLNILRKHKKAIGINPSICMHKIEKDARPIRQLQQRLNLTLLDVVKKEVTKLLTVGIIYPISNNQWVSLVQVVPK